MPPKRNNPLREQQGIAMIMVLCLGALFVALSAALVYAASLMMANANRQLPEQDVQELAVSFSDVLDQELQDYAGVKMDDQGNPKQDANGQLMEDADNSLGYFINHTYVKKGARDNYYGDDTDHVFTLAAPEGVDELTVTLRKTPGEDNDEDGNVRKSFTAADFANIASFRDNLISEEKTCSTAGVNDYNITVTVKVVKGDQSYSYSRQYKHTGFYQLYYTLGNNTNEELTRDTSTDDKDDAEKGDAIVFYNAVNDKKYVYANTTDTLYLRYRMDTATRCRFDRITTDN